MGVGEVRDRRRARARDQRVGGGRPAGRLPASRSPPCATRSWRQNADAAGGNVTRGPREETIRTIGRLADPRAFDDLVVATIGGAPVRVRDIGRAEDGTKEQRSTARLNGVPTVVLEVRRQSGANTVAVIEAVKKALERGAGGAAGGRRRSTVIQDQSRYIYAALHEINVHLVLGSILACLVVLGVHAELALDADRRAWRSRRR